MQLDMRVAIKSIFLMAQSTAIIQARRTSLQIMDRWGKCSKKGESGFLEESSALEKFANETINKVLLIFDDAGLALQCHSVYNNFVRKRVISHE